MDFFKNVFEKGVDAVKNQIKSFQENNPKPNNNNLPKDVHILGIDEYNNNNTNNNYNIINNYINNNSNDYDKFYYSQQNNNNNNQSVQPNKSSSSMSDFFKLNQPLKSNTKNEKEFMQGFNLLYGEKAIEYEYCKIQIGIKIYNCKAMVTNFRVYIIPELDAELANFYPDGYFSLPIHKIEKMNRIPQNFEFILEIVMNDARIISLILKTVNDENFPHVLSALLSTKQTPSFSQLAYNYNLNNPIYKKENFEDGWKLYDPEKEFARQGIDEKNNNINLRKTTLNEKYYLCPTYPKILITVKNINDINYRESSLFRTKNRLPALSYYHYNTRGTIWRSAQTKTGISGNRNLYDEELMNGIGELSYSKKLCIYDCRPYLSAMANRLKGAGHENIDNYKNAEITFCEIDNIHSARNSLSKIYSMLKSNGYSNNKKSISTFDGTNWPNFIYGIIQSSIKVAECVKKGFSVLVHCSDGWDRASQVTAFSQLLIDPYFRTIRGYMTLIEKDFLSFGHQFRFRNGYYSKEEVSENQQSPILLQYLDATHQLLVQYPMYFEFNMKFLLFIANNINSGLYGTFLYNNEKEREEKAVKENTMSIWTEILNNINEYKNSFYEKKSMEEYFFLPVFPMNRIRLWEEYFIPFTQIHLCISYDEYMNRWYGNYYNVFGQVKSKLSNENRMITNYMFYEKEKDEYNKNLEKKNKEIQNLKDLLTELCIKNNLDKNIFENLSNESSDTLKNFVKEKGGKIEINDEGTHYTFRKIKNMFEGIKDDNIIENKIKDNNIGKKEEIKDDKKEKIKEDKIEEINESKNEEKIDDDVKNKDNNNI